MQGRHIGFVKFGSQVLQYEYLMSSVDFFIPYFKIEQLFILRHFFIGKISSSSL